MLQGPPWFLIRLATLPLPLPLPLSAGTSNDSTTSPYERVEPQKKLKNVEAAAHSIVAARILDTLNNVMPTTVDQNNGEKLAIENGYIGNNDEGADTSDKLKENGYFAANQQTLDSRGHSKSTVSFAGLGGDMVDDAGTTIASQKSRSAA